MCNFVQCTLCEGHTRIESEGRKPGKIDIPNKPTYMSTEKKMKFIAKICKKQTKNCLFNKKENERNDTVQCTVYIEYTYTSSTSIIKKAHKFQQTIYLFK